MALYSQPRPAFRSLGPTSKEPRASSKEPQTGNKGAFEMDMNDIGYYLYMQGQEKGKEEILTPSYHGKDCRHNGEHEGFELACDECDFYLECFPDWKELSQE